MLLEDQERRPGVASEAGSILFSDTHRLDLIGSQPQFPITVIDFDDAGLDSDASFVVELANDPSMPVLSGLQLLINEKDSQLVEACRRGHTKTQPQKALLEQLDETVFLRLIEYAVDRADPLDYKQWETDSLGRVCAMLADQSGGVVELAEMRRRRHSSYQATAAGAARRRGMGRQLGATDKAPGASQKSCSSQFVKANDRSPLRPLNIPGRSTHQQAAAGSLQVSYRACGTVFSQLRRPMAFRSPLTTQNASNGTEKPQPRSTTRCR